MSIDARKKSERGRPPVDSEEVRARMHRPLISALDAFAADQPEPVPSRAEVIRRIVADHLRSKGYLKPSEGLRPDQLTTENDG